MKATIRTPFFEIGIKNYIYGDDVLKLALAADAAAQKYDIDTIFIAPYLDIRRIVENTKNLLVFAPYMDTLYPGRGLADVLPESVKAAGAKGVVINHCERPLTLASIRRIIQRADELDLISFACADSIAETQAIAQLHPDIINPEPSALIGTQTASDTDFAKASTAAVKSIHRDILVEQAAGITTGKQVFDLIYAGADGVGVASGIVNAQNPCAMADEMIRNVREAFHARKEFINESF